MQKAQILNAVETPALECILPAGYTVTKEGINKLEAARLAGEAHRRVRQTLQNAIQPGMTLAEIANKVENGTRTVLGKGLNKGIAFPTGLSLNACAAHDSPNPKSKEVVLQGSDVLKIDFGTHVDGYIVDSAFTVTFDAEYDNLLLAARESVYACLKIAGVDTPLREIGEVAEEVIRSYELKDNTNRPVSIRPVSNLNGHTIDRYKIHGGKYVPIVKRSGIKERMEEGEFYAIETFVTTGTGYVTEKGDCSHYALVKPSAHTPLEGGKQLLRYLNDTFSTLPFCKRYLDSGMKSTDAYLSHLVKTGAIESYPPLCDSANSLVAQFEHTFYVGASGIEIMSQGDDY